MKAVRYHGPRVPFRLEQIAFTVPPIQLVILEAKVRGSVWNTLSATEGAMRLAADGKVRTLVDRILPLESYADAQNALRAGQAMGRMVLRP